MKVHFFGWLVEPVTPVAAGVIMLAAVVVAFQLVAAGAGNSFRSPFPESRPKLSKRIWRSPSRYSPIQCCPVLRVVAGTCPLVSVRFGRQTHYGVLFPQEPRAA
eukprot:COSAG01_NODE_5757_length_4053_cov_25.842691_3_plen_104_part_00